MPKRDPEKTARNKVIKEMGLKLSKMLPEVLEITGYRNVQQLHAKFGSKNAVFLDVKNQVIHSPEQFVALWMQGFLRELKEREAYKQYSELHKLHKLIRENPLVKDYMIMFLERTYLREFEALSKVRPKDEDSVLWIGQENAHYGLLITPRFQNGEWENDKSEIRHFNHGYWTIGHVLETGLVIPSVNETMNFSSVDEYLRFFQHTLVRASGSPHEKEIARRYVEYVRASSHPEKIPLLIPELRYGGLAKKHLYRLDFCIIDTYSLSKIGFELSPWSTHGQITGAKQMTQKAINEVALANFEKEMAKVKDYYRRFGVFVLIYTDSDLQNHDKIFDDMKKYLEPQANAVQLKLQVMTEFDNYS